MTSTPRKIPISTTREFQKSLQHPSLTTRFGDTVDVRNRGTVRIGRFAGSQSALQNAPAVVRIWTDDHCRELTSNQARTFAAQLLEAALLAENQNSAGPPYLASSA